MSKYFSNAPTKAGWMPVTPTVACTLPGPRVTAMIFGFHQSARKGVDMSNAITSKEAAAAKKTCRDCEKKLTTTLAKKIETTTRTWRRRVISRACTRLCLACVAVSIFLARVVVTYYPGQKKKNGHLDNA